MTACFILTSVNFCCWLHLHLSVVLRSNMITIIIFCLFTISTSIWYVYSTYRTWEEDFAKKRVNRRSKHSPSNKDTPDPRCYDENVNLIKDLAEKHQNSFKSSIVLNPLQANGLKNQVIINRSNRFPSFISKPLDYDATMTEKRKIGMRRLKSKFANAKWR